MKTIAIDIRLIGKGRTGDEMVFRSLTEEILALSTEENRYLLLTDETERGRLARLSSSGAGTSSGKEHIEVVSLAGRNRFVWNLFTVPLFLLKAPCGCLSYAVHPPNLHSESDAGGGPHSRCLLLRSAVVHRLERTGYCCVHFFIPRSLKRSDTVIVPSQFTQDEILRYFEWRPIREDSRST
jgi:hypothetical protein